MGRSFRDSREEVVDACHSLAEEACDLGLVPEGRYEKLYARYGENQLLLVPTRERGGQGPDEDAVIVRSDFSAPDICRLDSGTPQLGLFNLEMIP